MTAFRRAVRARIDELRPRRVITLTLVAVLGGLRHAWAQDARAHLAQNAAQNVAGRRLGRANSSDFSLVVTSGNSASQTLGLSDQLRYTWPVALFSFDKLDTIFRTSLVLKF